MSAFIIADAAIGPGVGGINTCAEYKPVAKHTDNKMIFFFVILDKSLTIEDMSINAASQNTGMDIFQLGIMNPFGRKQETEADYLGLIFSSLSGFDIRESVKLWQRMYDKKKGKEPPVFLSTHPSSKKRIENLKGWINEVIINYPPIKA